MLRRGITDPVVVALGSRSDWDCLGSLAVVVRVGSLKRIDRLQPDDVPGVAPRAAAFGADESRALEGQRAPVLGADWIAGVASRIPVGPTNGRRSIAAQEPAQKSHGWLYDSARPERFDEPERGVPLSNVGTVSSGFRAIEIG